MTKIEGKNVTIELEDGTRITGQFIGFDTEETETLVSGWSYTASSIKPITFELRWHDPLADLWKAIEDWLWASWMGRN